VRTIAITRDVSATIDACELTHVTRMPIDVALAREQHAAYESSLATLGCEIRRISADDRYPDAVFVEDTAIVLDELAVITRPGAESRRGELDAVAAVLAEYRALVRIEPPATIDGGDVLQLDDVLYVGRTPRTNDEGIAQLRQLIAPYGYRVLGVDVDGCLHLKSAVTHIGRNTLLANRAWFDPAPFVGYDWLDVAPEEPHAANALALGETVIFPASFPHTRARIEAAGFHVTPLDISELQKAESGLSCSSLIFAQ